MGSSQRSVTAAIDAVAAGERAIVRDAAFDTALRDLALVALSRDATALAGQAETCWARLPLLACASAADGPPTAAVPLAIAVELQATAYSLLDDLEDGDPNEVARRAGPAVALNVATALLALAQRALASVPEAAARILSDGWLVACDGQHRDLTLAPDGTDPLGAALLAAHELETPSSPRPDAISGTASPGETPTAMGQG